MQYHRLSRIERSFWIDEIVGGTHNHLLVSFMLNERHDIATVRKALCLLLDENPQILSSVVLRNETAYWKMPDEPYYPIDETTLDGQPTDASLVDALQVFASLPFNLSEQPPCRFRFLRLPGRVLFVAVFHHIITEVKSVQLFTQRLSQLYNALTAHQAVIPQPSTIFSFADAMEAYYLQPDIADDVAYWNHYVATHPTDELTPYFPSSLQAGSITQHHFSFGPLAGQIIQFSEQFQLGRFRIFSAVWAIVLHRVFGIREICLNYPVSLRTPAFRDTMGVFVNNFLLYVSIPSQGTFLDLVSQIVKSRREAHAHERVSMLDTDVTKVVRNSFATAAFNFPLNRHEQRLELSGETIPLYHAAPTTMPSALQIDIEGDLSTGIIYTSGQYPSFFAKTLADAFLFVLKQVLSRPETAISNLAIVPQEDVFNTPVLPPSSPTPSLVAQFQAIAQTHARQPAVLFGNETLTYAQLDHLSDVVATLIVRRIHDSLPSDFVAVYASRSLYTVALFLGVWKAGRAFVPIDPDNAAERLQYILADSSPSLLLTDLESVPAQCPVLTITPQLLAATPPQPLSYMPHSLAYMIYTSGTTGHPKGTPISQQALLNLIEARQEYLPGSENTLELSFASISFDASIWDVFPALLTGTAVYYASDAERHDPSLLLDVMERQRVSCACIPPALLSYLPYRPLPSLRFLVTAGESCPAETIRKWQQTCRVMNAYGPTENTVCTTMHPYDATIQANNIGRPLRNVSCYVLDEQHHLLPPGVRGRLFIGGRQLTEGYLHQPQLNQRSFIPNPFATVQEQASHQNATLYDSGDIVFRLPDGNLVFCGRNDSQVKIHGHRIELSEIVSHIEQFPDVRMAVVQVLKRGERPVLTAFVETPDGTLDTGKLRLHLQQSLPPYMVPAAYVPVSQMPLTINRKVDLQALETLASATSETTGQSYASTPTEVAIRDIWQQLLGDQTNFDVDTNFLDLGGDSLAIIMMVQTLERQFGVAVPVAQAYEMPTIRHLAAYIDHSTVSISSAKVAETAVATGYEAPPPHLQSLLTQCLLSPQASRAYHLVLFISVDRPTDEHALLQAWNLLLQRQDGLRLSFLLDADGTPAMRIRPYVPAASLQHIVCPDDESFRSSVSQQLDQPYRFDGSQLCRPVSYTIGGQRQVLVVFMHHLITDGWSMSLLRKQFLDLLQGTTAQSSAPMSSSFADYVRSLAVTSSSDDNRRYWSQYLAGTEDLRLPYLPHSNATDLSAHLLTTQLSRRQADALSAYCRRHRLTPFAFLISAFMMVLARFCRQEEFLVGYPSSGRTDSRFANVIGYFVHPLPLRFCAGSWPRSFADFCSHVIASVRDSEQHLLAFSQLVELAGRQGGPQASSPLVQVMFAFEDHTPESLLALQAPAQFPLSLTVSRKANAPWDCVWKIATAQLPSEFIEVLSKAFAALVDNILERESDLPISALSLLSPSQRLDIITRNAISPLRPPLATVVSLFSEVVASAPHPWVVKDAHVTLTYRQLDQQSSAVASVLLRHAVGNVATGVLMARSASMVSAVLGVLKAGHTYVPLSANYPPERIRAIVADSGMRCLLYDRTMQPFVSSLALPATLLLVCFDDCVSAPSPLAPCPSPLAPTIRGNHCAYIIYTSGTTGTPKGVAVSHANLAALVTIGGRGRCNPSTADVVLQYHAYVFDASINDLFPALLSGAQLVVASEAERHDPQQLFALIEREHVTYASIPPALLQHCPEQLPSSLRTLVMGGEAPSQQVISRYAHQLTLFNEYGPSENTVTATVCQVGTDGPARPDCIGSPLAGVSCYVLDDHQNLLPPGCPGQLFVGGLQLFLGYRNRPELNADKLIENPFVTPADRLADINTRLYATGDIVCQEPSGRFLFLGRKDFQVKLRGFRIELHEIEQVLLAHPAVSQCVVTVRGEGDDRQLAAYVATTQPGVQPSQLRQHLAQHLPAYMLPTYWYIAESLPMNNSGKIDRSKLPAPQHYHLSAASAPSEGGERPNEAFSTVIARVLHLDTSVVQADSDIFADLGATSLQVLQLAARLREAGLVVSPSDIFRLRTVGRILHTGSSVAVSWYEGYDAQLPVAVLVCGYTAAHPFYSSYLQLLRQRYSVLVFDTFTYWNDQQTNAPAYVDWLLQQTLQATRSVDARVSLVTGHSVGSELAILLAEQLRQHHHPDVQVVAIGTAWHHDAQQLSLLSADDDSLRTMLATMPSLVFGGRLTLVLEQRPSASLVLNGPESEAYSQASAAFITKNIEAWHSHYPDAHILLLDTDHFSLLQPHYLEQITMP